jgi:hypothetical protein
MLAPGEKKTRRAYVWAYSTTPFSALKAVVYDFSPSRASEHARNFLGSWNGKLVCDDFAGYKAGFEKGMTEIGCMAHARRKFFDLHVANKSQLAEQALHSIGGLYEVERQARDMSDEDRWRIRQEKSGTVSESTARLDVDPERSCAQWISDGQGTGLQPQTLGSADALLGRWGRAHKQRVSTLISVTTCCRAFNSPGRDPGARR